MPKIPSYRKRKDRSQALVTLTDAVTKCRRDYWLGEYDTPESRERYHRLIAEWEARGRRLPPADFQDPAAPHASGVTISEVIHAFWQHARAYADEGELRSIQTVLRLMRKYFGSSPACEFGPKKLRWLREQMIRGEDLSRPWSRKYINVQVQRIRRVLKGAVAEVLVPGEIYHAHRTTGGLRPRLHDNNVVRGVAALRLRRVVTLERLMPAPALSRRRGCVSALSGGGNGVTRPAASPSWRACLRVVRRRRVAGSTAAAGSGPPMAPIRWFRPR